MNRLTIDLGERSYDVVIGVDARDELTDALDSLPGRTDSAIALVADEHVWPLHGEATHQKLARGGRRVTVHGIPQGETAKELAPFGALHDDLLAGGHDRHSVLVALGGGATGDLAGFVAATFMRGIRLVQVPTTVLAMVDASVGGKTAINLRAGKNLVGAFHQPILVVADLTCLGTLPAREYRAGLGEILKYGLMSEPSMLDLVQARLVPCQGMAEPAVLEEVVTRSVAIKADYVASDEHEAGVRQHLNLGHTFAHGLEAATNYQGYRHGEAVALGLIAACRLGELTVGLAAKVTDRIRRLVEAVGLPARTDLEPAVVRAHMGSDKKQAGGRLRFVVPRKIGCLELLDEPAQETVLEALRAIH